MTKKDFFRILIKVFGLYSIVTALFTVLPSNISVVLYDMFHDIEIFSFIYLLLILAFIVFLFVFLIKKPDTIIRWLKLDSGFDDDKIYFEKLNSENIIKLASIIIGGLLIIDNIPSFLSHTYFAFKSSVSGSETVPQQNINWAISFLNIIVGYLLVSNFDKVGRLLKEKENVA